MFPVEKRPRWFSPESSNCWSFSRCEPRWVNPEVEEGWRQFGLFPGQIFANLLSYFAEPEDLVIDPMAGSGTAELVCKDFGLECRMFDLTPRAPGVMQNDSVESIPIENGRAGMVFLDPPYWQILQYSEDPRDLSRMTYREFISASKKLIHEAVRVTRSGGHLAVMMSSVWRNVGQIRDYPLDLSMLYYRISRQESVDLVERIAVENQHFENPSGAFARRHRAQKAMLRGFRDIFVFRKRQPAPVDNQVEADLRGDPKEEGTLHSPTEG